MKLVERRRASEPRYQKQQRCENKAGQGLWDAGARGTAPGRDQHAAGTGPGSELQWGKEAGEVRPGLPSMCVQSRMEILEQNKKKGSGR